VSQAEPLNTPLHPTQLYSVFLIGSILVILLMLKRHKRFEGQLFFIYVMSYAFGRSVIEIFRGDGRRGFVIEDVLSHSQFISIFVITGALWAYFYLYRRQQRRIKGD
jgi:phosphatidylglycerol:prolipoprotein diacylglycerol transferase